MNLTDRVWMVYRRPDGTYDWANTSCPHDMVIEAGLKLSEAMDLAEMLNNPNTSVSLESL